MTFVPISAAELSWMRRDETASLTDLCSIQRKGAAAADSTGGPTKAAGSYTNKYTGVACRVTYRRDRIEADEVLAALQKQNINVWTLIVAFGTDLLVDDQVILTNTGLKYLVLGLSTARTNNTKLTAYMKEIGA